MFSAAATPPRLSTLVLLSGLSVLSLNMFLPSLSNIAETFQADYALVNLSVAGYLVVTAVLMLIMGPLSDRFGRRPVILAGLVIFIMASLGCALAPNVWLFLAFRMFQGAVIAGALSPAVIRDMVPPQAAASQIGYVAMAMAVAPMLGPMFGGLLDELFGWRASFVVFIALGSAVLALCWSDLGETNKAPSETFMTQFTTYPALLRSRRYWGYALCMAFSTGGFYIFLSGSPLVAGSELKLSTASLGFYMGTITGGFAVGSFLSGRYAKRFALTTMVIAGRLAACAGLSAGLVLVLAGYVNAFSIFGATVFVGLGNGLTMPSANSGAMSVRPQLAGSASGLSGALTVGAGAVLTLITGAILTEGNGAWALLSIMLFSSSVALLAGLYVRWIDRRQAH